MKKLLLLATVLICMSSVMAQQFESPRPSALDLTKRLAFSENLTSPKGFTYRMDSIDFLGLTTIISFYDQNYLCTKDVINGSTVWEYTYNNQNQLFIAIVEDLKYEFYYNEHGLIKELIVYDESNGNWILDERTTLSYNAYDQPLVITSYQRRNNEWVYSNKEEYTYNNDQLVVMIESQWQNNSVWKETYKSEFERYPSGDVKTVIRYGKANDNSWEARYKYECQVDQHHNLTDYYQYNKNNDDYVLSQEMHYYYDNNVPLEKVAYSAFMKTFLFELYYPPYFDPHDLISSIDNLISSSTQPISTIFYYTDMTSVGESDGAQLVISPNPAHETLSLSAQELRQVEIYSLDGKLVMQVKDRFDAIQVGQLANGCYVLRATMNDGSFATQKFVKQ